MEETAFKKDETPYLVFTCKKCRQYSYVKTTQKTKKCLRCGRTHQVKDILGLGEVVYGMTAAVNTVKQKQTELATPEFRSEGDFVVATNKLSTRTPVKKSKGKVLRIKTAIRTLILILRNSLSRFCSNYRSCTVNFLDTCSRSWQKTTEFRLWN